MTQTCSRCETELARPLPENAYYVTHTDFTSVEPTPVYIGIKLTPRVKQNVRALNRLLNISREEIAVNITHPDAPETIEYTYGRTESEDGTITANIKEAPFSVDTFEEVEVESPQAVHDDPDIVRVEQRIEEREVQKTGVVCPDCVKPDEDDIHWGPDV